MPNNWKTYRIEEICTNITSGGTPNTRKLEYYNGNIPWLKTQEVNFNRIYNTDVKITEDGLKKSSAKIIPKDSVIIAMYGATAGRLAINKIPLCTNQACCNLTINNTKADFQFIYYNLLSRFDRIADMAVGGAQQNLNAGMIKNLEVQLPPLQEQKSIASILSAIDDKIENNLAINKTLEEMAMALYKHWFVDFGPFQEGEFVESELGRIPKGWEVKRLENFVEVLSKGTTPRMKDVEGLERKIPFLKVKDIKSDGEININGLELIPEETHLKDLKRSILFENDLLFSIAGTIGRVSIVNEKLNNSNCNQALAFIRLKEREKFKAIIYYWLKSDDVQNKIQNSIVQGVQANVSLTVLKELELIEPSNEILIDFANKVNPILELVLKNQKENQTLTQLRDTLLPKLISGEVRLKEFKESITN
jgi:type I restriction enzyme S subunit